MSMSLEYTQERRAELEANIKAVEDEMPGQARLVAISKLKPASDIQALYDAGYRHFGENYIQELVDKAEVLPKDINWHFVGALQSNKSKLAAGIPNLFVLETLSSIKVADLLQKSLATSSHTLNVYLQVNTSAEDSKSGLSPSSSSSAVIELANHIRDHCDKLSVLGLMTIGSWDASHTDPDIENPDFSTLKRVRQDLKEKGIQGKDGNELELSMGMSADFAQAIKQGSSSVRVGTRIFGERPKKSGA